jgi:glycerol-3-phosphate O-acyltransferase/dihydroxyacetone phosphate acyltransferase
MFYWLMRAILRHALRVFFRSIEIEGLESVPREGPLLLAANHPNTLMDVLLVAVLLDRQVGCLAKATLFKNPFVGFLFRSLGAVPVHRKQDGGSDASSAANQNVLEDSEIAVAEGKAILIFPEGVSQDEPRLQRLKTGLARIALGAEKRAPGQVSVVPVALVYDDHETFRSRARVTYLPAIQVGPFLALGEARGDEFAAARALTDAIGESLKQDLVHVDDEGNDPLVDELDELYGHVAREQAGGRLAVTPVVARAVNHFTQEDPERLQRVREQVSAYRAALEEAGVSDAALREQERHDRLIDDLLFAGFTLPALWGALNHLPLYNAPRAALRLIPIHPIYNASAKMVVGLVALVASYAIQGYGVYLLASGPGADALRSVGIATPLAAALVYLGTLPMCGMIALLWLEAWESRRRRSRARGSRDRLGLEKLAGLREQRSALFAQLDAAQAEFLDLTAAGGNPEEDGTLEPGGEPGA